MPADYIIEQPTLCMVTGVPGSGKSMLAGHLAYRIVNAAYESKDRIQKHFTKERASGNEYSMIQGPTFELLVDFSDTQLGLGKIPVIDAPFSINHTRNDKYRDWVPRFKEVADRRGSRLAIVRCVPPSESEQRRRIEERYKTGKSPWDEWKLANWDEFMRKEPHEFPIPYDDVYEFVSEGLFSNEAEIVMTNFLKAQKHQHFL
jgi:predicted kinase